MRNPAILLALTFMILGAGLVSAQGPLAVRYQARLTDNLGDPVNGNYEIVFKIYNDSTGGELLWSESHPSVNINNGLFSVFMGRHTTLDPSVFQDPNLFLEVQVVGDVPMAPRSRLGSVPLGAISRRLSGDAETEPGIFRLMNAAYDRAALEMTTDISGNVFGMNKMEPLDSPVRAFEMSSDGISSIFSMNRMEPLDSPIHAFEMASDATSNVFGINKMEPLDSPVRAFEMSSDGISSIFSMNRMEPLDSPVHSFEMISNATGNVFRMNKMEPLDSPAHAVEMTSDNQSNSILMFGMEPLDSPPALINISSGLGNVGSMVMFNPQPEPPAILSSLVASPEGSSFSFYAPSPTAQGNLMFDIYADQNGGSFTISDEIGQYMGVEPSPFYEGGTLKMIDPNTENTTASLGSDGLLTARKGTFGNSSNNGIYNLVVGTSCQANGDYNIVSGYSAESNHNNCFLWADYSGVIPLVSTASNQFLVKSTGGIKFFTDPEMIFGVQLTPGSSAWSTLSDKAAKRNIRPIDGLDIINKIDRLPVSQWSYKSQDESIEHIGPMAQDFYTIFGIGEDDKHISTIDPSGVALAGVKELINENRELKAKLVALEKRLSELERKM